jgi:hypothetical protein
VQNLLRNRDYRQYYLDYLETLLDTTGSACWRFVPVSG